MSGFIIDADIAKAKTIHKRFYIDRVYFEASKENKAEKFLGSMMDRLSWLPIEDFLFRPQLSKDYIVNAHWALYCENYLEGFHIPFVHVALNAVIDYGDYTTELFPLSVLQLGI